MYYMSNWRHLTSDPWVLESIAGYHLEFENVPFQVSLPKPPPFNETEMDLIDKEIEKLLAKGAIDYAFSCKDDFISNIFLVPKKYW